jgi:DNA-binding NarL/FixJ family response regulator
MSRESAGRALRITREREVQDAVARALAADPTLLKLASTPALENLREVFVGELVDALRLANGDAQPRPRHLRPLPAGKAGIGMRACLSDREFGVVHLIVEGLSNKQISLRLALSEKTVKNHVSHILRKLKLRARTQVAVMALRGGFA